VTPGTAIALALLMPVVCALGVALLGRNANVRDGWTILCGAITLPLVLVIAGDVLDGGRPTLDLMEVFPGVVLGFQVEPLGLVYALVAAGLWPITSFYAFGYMRGHHEENQTRFFVCFALAISAALGIAFSRNLFTLFLFYEVLTFSTYPLVTHHGTWASSCPRRWRSSCWR
jgi:multicomponent Na+:H+ antiporter subunit D